MGKLNIKGMSNKMKHGKRLTVEMKVLLKKYGYDPENFLFTKNTNYKIEFVNRNTNERIVIDRY